MRKSEKYILLVSSIIIFFGIGYQFYLTHLDGTTFGKVIEFKNLTLETEKQIYHPGDTVRAYVSFCKYRDVVPKINDALVDDYLTLYDERYASSGVIGCKDNLLIDLEKIPMNEFPGTYHFNRTLTYPLLKRNLVFQLQTNDFKVIK